VGYIKEPPGIDFLIGPHPYTDEDRAAVTAFIQSQRAKVIGRVKEKEPVARKTGKTILRLKENIKRT